MTLAAAITDLRDTITEEGFTADLVADVADEWGVNPALLERKFAERYGKAPADYKAVSRAQLRAMAIEKAMAEAIKSSERFEGGSDVLGKAFTDAEGEEYIAVAIAVGGLRAVQVLNGRWVKFGNSGQDAVRAARRFGLI
jgi:hypothetical protein